MNKEFQTFQLNAQGKSAVGKVRDIFDSALSEITRFLPKGREQALVHTKMEEACFYAVKCVAMFERNQEVDPRIPAASVESGAV